MTARIGYLAALAPGQSGAAGLRPPRRLFPIAEPPDAELSSWPARSGRPVPPGPADAGRPVPRVPAGRLALGPPGRSTGDDGEPRRGEAAAEPDGALLPADRVPAGLAAALGAAGTEPRPAGKLPAATAGPRGGLEPGTGVNALAGAGGLAGGEREPRAPGAAAERASTGTAGLTPGGAPAQAPFIPADTAPGAGPGPQPAAPASGNAAAFSPVADLAPAQRASAGPARYPAGEGTSGRSQAAVTEPGYHGAGVMHDVRSLSRDQAALPPPPGDLPVAEAAPAGGPARAAAGQPPGEPAPPAAQELVPRRPPQARPKSAPATSSTPRPTLSIGTIEVTLVAPPHQPPPAGASPRQRRPPPDQLTPGLGPRFGHGQT